MKEVIENLKRLYIDWADEEVISVSPLVQSGSYRKYFRIISSKKNAIGVFNPDGKENRALISFTKHFLKKGLNVPHLFAQNLKENIYLIEDLGDTTLFSLIDKEKINHSLSEKVLSYYKDALNQLIRFQIDGGKGLDYSVCYPRSKFDKQSISWDFPGKRRCRAGAEIETAASRRQAPLQRQEEAAQEPAIAGVVGGVPVQVVSSFFLFCRQEEGGRNEHQTADLAAHKGPALAAEKDAQLFPNT